MASIRECLVCGLHDLDHWELVEGGNKCTAQDSSDCPVSMADARQDSSLSIPTKLYYRMRQAIYRAREQL